MDLSLLAMIAFGLVAGGLIKGMTGMGMPLVSMPLLTAAIGLPSAIGLLTTSYIVSNLWQMASHAQHAGAIMPLLRRFLIFGTLGAVVGSAFVSIAPTDLLSAMLGALLLAYCLTRLLAPHLIISTMHATRLAPALGLISGLLHGATGISSPVAGPFFHAISTSREQYIFAISAMLLLFSITQGAVLIGSGAIPSALLLWSLAAVIPVFVAMQLGNALATRVNQRLFEHGMLLFLAIMGLRLLIVGWMNL
jgi:uncharacterized membrane protein YfcA